MPMKRSKENQEPDYKDEEELEEEQGEETGEITRDQVF
jgi:hypothetical protein